MKGNCLPVGACLHYQWIIQQYSPPRCSGYQPCFSPSPPGALLLLSTAAENRESWGHVEGFHFSRAKGHEGRACASASSRKTKALWLCSSALSRLHVPSMKQMKGGSVPTARVNEHENVHHLLYNHCRLNKLFLLVSCISFSKNRRSGGNLLEKVTANRMVLICKRMADPAWGPFWHGTQATGENSLGYRNSRKIRSHTAHLRAFFWT